METPKPGPHKKPVPEAPKVEKKPYIRPEHLTHRPLASNEALLKLRETQNKSVRKLGFKSQNSRGGKR